MSRSNRTSAKIPLAKWSAPCLAAAAGLGICLVVQAAETDLRVNAERIEQHIMALAEFGKNREGGVSRVAFSDADIAGREYIMGLMGTAGLKVRMDTAGNLIGRREGKEDLPTIMFGSHSDSVPGGGNYDGDVGVMGAIEVAQVLDENNVVTRHPLEVVVFVDQEGGLVGSRAMIGELSAPALEVVSHSGLTIAGGIRALGGDPGRLDEARRESRDLAARKIELLYDRVYAEARRIAMKHKTPIGFQHLDVDAVPAPTDERLRAIIAGAAESLGLSHIVMPSGAGHDAQDMARITPTGMIFVPSVGGISHSPREFTHPRDMANGADVLLRTVLRLDQGGLENPPQEPAS